jgi:hypothetical protein
MRPVPVLYNKVRGRALREVIDVLYRDTFLVDGSVVNESIAGITSTVPGQHHDWRGPFVAYGKRGRDMDSPHARDLDMHDFRHVVDFLFIYSTNLALDIPQSTPQGNDVKVRGVKINCDSDCRKHKKPKYEAVDVPLTDPIFAKHDTSDIADRIGLPIFTRRCQTEVSEDYVNQDATFLHLCCDPTAKFDSDSGIVGWAFAPMRWQDPAGTVLVVRQDKKPLAPLHMEALCRYCRYEIRPLLAHTIGEYAPDKPLDKKLVLDMICRPTFSIWWYKLTDEKRHNKEKVDAPFPYEA